MLVSSIVSGGHSLGVLLGESSPVALGIAVLATLGLAARDGDALDIRTRGRWTREL